MYSMNTPSGTANTALDKFVLHYAAMGYSWEMANDDFIFSKPGSTLYAKAVINETTGWITGFNISTKEV